MKEHLNAVIDALTAWRDSLEPPPPVMIEPEPPAPPPVEPEPEPEPPAPAPVIERKPAPPPRKPKKTEAEIAEEAARIAQRIAHYRFWLRKGIFLDLKQRCKARKTDIRFAAGAPSLIDVSWGGRCTPTQWVAEKQKATCAEIELCGFNPEGGRHGR